MDRVLNAEDKTRKRRKEGGGFTKRQQMELKKDSQKKVRSRDLSRSSIFFFFDLSWRYFHPSTYLRNLTFYSAEQEELWRSSVAVENNWSHGLKKKRMKAKQFIAY